MFNAEAVDESLAELRKYGKWVIFGTRFTPIIRGPIYVAAGLSKMGVFNFFKIDATAALFQVPLLMVVGRLIGKKCGVFNARISTHRNFDARPFGRDCRLQYFCREKKSQKKDPRLTYSPVAPNLFCSVAVTAAPVRTMIQLM